MQSNPVVFIAFLEQDNLGIGYMASVLLENNVDVRIIDFRLEKEYILEQLTKCDPLMVGFSVIFQYHIFDFKNLIAYLRRNGVHCHFTAGGHYPSLRYKDLFNIIPELDSVVLFEGEYTILDLARALRTDKQWKQIEGIAYRENTVIENPLRPLERDLDNFPVPVRQPLKEYALGKKYATILAGRGCYYNCSFCSIRQFYSRPPGGVKRIRDAEMVVREMELLHRQLDCSIFMFQDDDFPVMGSKGREWTGKFCELLLQKGLSDKLMWKINCRADEIETDLFNLMKDCGLFLVYLGIEDGTDDGLQVMNKHLSAEANIRAVNTLKRLGIEYDFGFMLFHPETTFQSIVSNLTFLEKVCGDGSSPITYCKMLPYAETSIEHRLKQERRLKGKPGFEDYDFKDAAIDRFYCFLTRCFKDWIGSHEGVLNLARWARYTLSVYRKYYPITTSFDNLDQRLHESIARSNCFFVDCAVEFLEMFSDHSEQELDIARLLDAMNRVDHEHVRYQYEFNGLIHEIQKMTVERQ